MPDGSLTAMVNVAVPTGASSGLSVMSGMPLSTATLDELDDGSTDDDDDELVGDDWLALTVKSQNAGSQLSSPE